VRRRLTALSVLVMFSTGIASGYQCLWDCSTAPAAETDHCAPDRGTPVAADPVVAAAHDCADHRVETAPATLTARVDTCVPLVPVVSSEVSGPSSRAAARALVAVRHEIPPVRFLAPLRL
jgi:hypothetical protein